jgi:hypothetical protein
MNHDQWSVQIGAPLCSSAWMKNTTGAHERDNPGILLAAGRLTLTAVLVGKAVKGWFSACYAVLMVLALAYWAWRWLG